MEWQPDWSLRLRMVATLVLLGGLYAGFVATLSAATGSVLLVGAGALVAVALQYYYGPSVTLRAVGADRVSEAAYPDLHARVDRLAKQARLPKPDVAVVAAREPNAFVVGRSRESATVCVSVGLLEALDGDQLDAVLAHELAHVKHRDVALLTAVSALSTVAYLVVRHAWVFGDGDGGDGGGDQWILVAFVASLVVWVASYLLIRLLSRYREFAADRGAVAITGDPAALAGALETIAGVDAPDGDLRAEAGVSALYLVPEEADSRVQSLMRTHPPVERRVDRLREMEATRR